MSENHPLELPTPPRLSVSENLGLELPGARLTVPAEPEQQFPVRHTDWNQLRRKIDGIRNPLPNLGSVAWACVGIAAAALCAYFPWAAVYAGLPTEAHFQYSYVSPLLAILAIASVIVSVICFVINHAMKKMESISISNVLSDMDSIYSPFRLPGERADEDKGETHSVWPQLFRRPG